MDSDDEMDANIVDKSECVAPSRAEISDFEINRLDESDQIAFADSDTEYSLDMFIDSAVIEVTQCTDNPFVRNETTSDKQMLLDADKLSHPETGNINSASCEREYN